MVQTGAKGVRAAFTDATNKLARAAEQSDPAPTEKRGTYDAGQWPGAPFDKLPPDCPVVPLGIDGKVAYFIDSVGQLVPVTTSEWGKKMLVQLFCSKPNFIAWAWPRFSAPKPGKKSSINGIEVDEACACLLKAAASKGLFHPVDRVRGRGAWVDKMGRLIWHSGELLWTNENGKLKASAPGEIDGTFYPRRPAILEPWQEPVDPSDSPAHGIFKVLKSWTWERPQIDPVIVLGGLAAMMIGGALPWRPHVAAMGDRGVGKSELNNLIKGIIGDALHDTGNTTAAGIYQKIGLDTLPVAVDEFEASEDNRRTTAIIELIRISSSGARMFRGGQDHQGVEFQARNAFFCSGINLPPMKAQDKSRFAVLNLDKLQVGTEKPPTIKAETGRMILRALMDAWPDFEHTLGDWKAILRGSGMDGRAQDTYGTLFALAELLLGTEAMEAIGLPVTEAQKLGDMIAAATAGERADQIDNWRGCLEHLLGATIDAWKGGEKPTIGALTEMLDAPGGEVDLSKVRERLAVAGCGIVMEARSVDRRDTHTTSDVKLAEELIPADRYLLAVPNSSPALQRLYQNTKWSDGVWTGALKQGPQDIVIRDRGNKQVVKINRQAARCLLIDLKAYDKLTEVK